VYNFKDIKVIKNMKKEGIVGSRIEEAYEDISTVVLNVLQAELSTAPGAE
jgi:hypothetical protein